MAGQTHQLPFSEVDAFTLRQLIYEGPHTLVFKGYQPSLERAVVIKLLKPHVQNREEWVARFRREARACAKLKHPNIVDVYALGEKNGYHYIASEYVDGPGVKELLKTSVPLPLNIALSITFQVLQALSFVHQHQIVHRDVKPGNILINSQGQAKLSDFGLAQIEEEPTVTQQGSIIGTPAYMAPEQIMGGPLDGRADLFALGAVLYEMLSGRQAFAGENYSTCLYKVVNEQPPVLSQLQPDLPEEIAIYQEIFLQKSPEKRWHDASEALQSLAGQLNMDTDAKAVAEFIRPLLTESSEKVKKADVRQAAASRDEKSSVTKQPTHRKRRWIMIGALGAVAVLILFIWMQMIPGSPVRSENVTESVSPQVPDSSRTDSGAAVKSTIDSAVFITATGSQKDDEKNDKAPPGNQLSQTARAATSGDTLPGESAPGQLAVVTDSLPAVSQSGDFPALQLDIRAEPWAKIIIDGQEADSHAVRLNMTVEPGQHTITFLHPNFSPQVFQVDIQPGEQKSLQWSFLENAGYLWVEARPWADIFIDDKFRDTTPLDNPLILSTGEHLLELKHPALSTYREHIKIQAGDTLQVHVTLKGN